MVDPGGNWLRFYRSGATESMDDESDDEKPPRTGLARVVDESARELIAATRSRIAGDA